MPHSWGIFHVIPMFPRSINHMGVSENSVPLFTQWFCWSLSLLNGYFIGNIPYFQTNPYQIDFLSQTTVVFFKTRPRLVIWPGHVRKKCSSKQLAKVGELCEEGKAATVADFGHVGSPDWCFFWMFVDPQMLGFLFLEMKITSWGGDFGASSLVVFFGCEQKGRRQPLKRFWQLVFTAWKAAGFLLVKPWQ